jgi:hypothetical protein
MVQTSHFGPQMTGEAHEHCDSSWTELGYACGTEHETSLDVEYVVGVLIMNKVPYFFLLFNGAVSF